MKLRYIPCCLLIASVHLMCCGVPKHKIAKLSDDRYASLDRTHTDRPCAPSQVLSPSPYLDPNLFAYDEKLISALARSRPLTHQPIRFAPRRPPDQLRFKIDTQAFARGERAGGTARKPRHDVKHLFHPYLPLVIVVQQDGPGAATQMNVFARL